eukprot:6872127-Ditylum_brightwellii.AAC.1
MLPQGLLFSLHCSDGHSLLQCDVLLQFFDIVLKDGMDLSKPIQYSSTAITFYPVPEPCPQGWRWPTLTRIVP